MLGGWLFDRAARLPGGGLRLVTWALVGSAGLGAAGWLCSDARLFLGVESLAVLLYLLVTAPTLALSQSIAPEGLQATSAAIMQTSISLVGASCGPLLTGAISDALHPGYGRLSLSYGLAFMAVFQLAGAFFHHRVGRGLRRSAPARAEAVPAS